MALVRSHQRSDQGAVEERLVAPVHDAHKPPKLRHDPLEAGELQVQSARKGGEETSSHLVEDQLEDEGGGNHHKVSHLALVSVNPRASLAALPGMTS
eukprot:755562-Hanusia_phi.AAC.1